MTIDHFISDQILTLTSSNESAWSWTAPKPRIIRIKDLIIFCICHIDIVNKNQFISWSILKINKDDDFKMCMKL